MRGAIRRGWESLGSLSTVAVLLAMAGVAYWGHRTGWRAPKLSDLRGAGAAEVAAAAVDWCEEHVVPESRCIKCHPELVGGDMKDWCPEHGTKESTCTLCHPEILTTGVAGDWCPEHAMPESSCTLCHPEIAAIGEAPPSETGITVTADATAPAGTTRPTSRPAAAGTVAKAGDAKGEKPAKPAKDPKTCQTHTMKVQFASGESVRRAGVRLAGVVERPMTNVLNTYAEVDYNRTRFAQISPRALGTAWRVDVEVGQAVKQGDLLALIDAAEAGRAKSEFWAAVADVEVKNKIVQRLRASSEEGFKSEVDVQEAIAASREASTRLINAEQALVNLGLRPDKETALKLPERDRVRLLGLPDAVVKSLEAEATTANLLPVFAPFDGVIVDRKVVAGESVEPTRPLFEIADTSKMWVVLDLPTADARRVKIGQEVTFRPDGARDEAAVGQVTWISTAVDDQTRTVRIRADVDNPDGRLLAHSFGTAQITIRRSPKAIAIPTDAIQWEGCCHIVFVRLADDIFGVRKVKLGAQANGFTEVTNGLLPGEVLAAAGSHVMKSELLKSALGAGCCVEE
jgi:cobalt-zinc-cadmium efflux system membrane fusion protein